MVECPECHSKKVKTIVKNPKPRTNQGCGWRCTRPIPYTKYKCKKCKYVWEGGQWTGKGFASY